MLRVSVFELLFVTHLVNEQWPPGGRRVHMTCLTSSRLQLIETLPLLFCSFAENGCQLIANELPRSLLNSTWNEMHRDKQSSCLLLAEKSSFCNCQWFYYVSWVAHILCTVCWKLHSQSILSKGTSEDCTSMHFKQNI